MSCLTISELRAHHLPSATEDWTKARWERRTSRWPATGKRLRVEVIEYTGYAVRHFEDVTTSHASDGLAAELTCFSFNDVCFAVDGQR